MTLRALVLPVFTGAALLATSIAVEAQGRPSTLRMSCEAAHNLVMRSGAIVLATGGHTYDRFVRHRGYCTPLEITQPAFVPTGDNPQCFIGYTCEPNMPDFPDRD